MGFAVFVSQVHQHQVAVTVELENAVACRFKCLGFAFLKKEGMRGYLGTATAEIEPEQPFVSAKVHPMTPSIPG